MCSQSQLGQEGLYSLVLLQLIDGLGVDGLEVPVKGAALEALAKGAPLFEVLFCSVGSEEGLLLQKEEGLRTHPPQVCISHSSAVQVGTNL